MDVMDRDQTIEFLRRHVKTEMLMKHLLSVEASMRGYARKFGDDQDRWAIAGLLQTSTGKSALHRRTTQSTAQKFCGSTAIRRTSSVRC